MLWERMLRAARLDTTVYEEVERDPNATSQALLVVVIVAVLGGIGGGVRLGVLGFVGGIIAAIVAWIVWSLITYLIGTTVFKGTATFGEMLRCIGFAYTPSALRLFAFIPFLGGIIVLVALIWTLFTMIIAIRQALDISTGQAIITAVIAWIINAIIAAILAAIGLGVAMGFGGM